MKQFISLFCIGIISLFCCVSGYGQTAKIEKLTKTSFIANAPKSITIGNLLYVLVRSSDCSCRYECESIRGSLHNDYLEELENKINNEWHLGKRYQVYTNHITDKKENSYIEIVDETLKQEILSYQRIQRSKKVSSSIEFNY